MRSSTYCARPVTLSAPSLRRTFRPTAPPGRDIAHDYMSGPGTGTALPPAARSDVDEVVHFCVLCVQSGSSLQFMARDRNRTRPGRRRRAGAAGDARRRPSPGCCRLALRGRRRRKRSSPSAMCMAPTIGWSRFSVRRRSSTPGCGGRPGKRISSSSAMSSTAVRTRGRRSTCSRVSARTPRARAAPCTRCWGITRSCGCSVICGSRRQASTRRSPPPARKRFGSGSSSRQRRRSASSS